MQMIMSAFYLKGGVIVASPILSEAKEGYRVNRQNHQSC